MFQVIIWWIYDAIINGLYVGLCDYFQRGLCQKLYLFHISSRINETWYIVTVVFRSFEIGPNSWLN